MSFDHPLGDQELRQFRQVPGGERQVVVDRPAQRDLLDLPDRDGESLVRWPPTSLGWRHAATRPAMSG
jgi:hypothetical protein